MNTHSEFSHLERRLAMYVKHCRQTLALSRTFNTGFAKHSALATARTALDKATRAREEMAALSLTQRMH